MEPVFNGDAFRSHTTMEPVFTKATLFAHKKLKAVTADERIRASYQYACLSYVTATAMTHGTLRNRFGIEEPNDAKASRLIHMMVV